MEYKHCNKSTHRTETKKILRNQIKNYRRSSKSIAKMVAEDKYCNDILIQLLAINKSLKSLNKKILKM